ncbi:hypothetical protein [Chromobacterium haemolyticum]|uniref:hypothetical protein n=1 Tax=Chromobacterium haemolyticum TaxID=394935 RepID=UPI000D2F6FA2|nr:hypothetical protein [Chromobacterium haemolyticum]PTU68609.1 hypothetical protein DBB33_03705 [Chromobacterium haemolyticum]
MRVVEYSEKALHSGSIRYTLRVELEGRVLESRFEDLRRFSFTAYEKEIMHKYAKERLKQGILEEVSKELFKI